MKKFFFGMAVLLGASLSFFSCEQDAKTETVYVPGPSEMIHIDTVATNEAALKTALLLPGDLVIGLTDDATLTAALTIPDGKVVYVLKGATLATDSGGKDLTVEGIVYVGAGATLDTSTGKVKVPGDGRVYVVGGMTTGVVAGTLVIANPDDVNDGATPTPATVLGTSKVSIGNATLKADSTVTLANNDEVAAALAYVGSGGTIDLSEATVTASKPSTLAAISLGEKKLIATATVAETETGTLTVPAGLALTAKSDDTLATITGLTVNGSLTTAAGTLAAVTTLTVNGELDAETATLAAVTTVSGTGTLVAGVVSAAKAEAVIESGLKSVSLASTAITADEGLTVPAATTLTLNAAAAPSGDVTVNGKVIVPAGGSLTILAAKTLENNGAVALTGTGSVVLTTAASGTTGGAKLTGTGTLTAQDLEISGGAGGWLAVLDSGASAETVTIASTVTAGQAAITGSTTNTTASLAGGTDATITQKAGTASNSLTLTTVTLDLSAAGSLTLKGADTDGASLVLTAAGVIKGTGTTGTVTTANISAIGGVTVSGNITVGSSLIFTDNATGNVFYTITGSASDNTLVAKKTGTDVVLDKTTTLAYS